MLRQEKPTTTVTQTADAVPRVSTSTVMAAATPNMSGGAIGGIVGGIVGGFVVLGAVTFVYVSRTRECKQSDSDEGLTGPEAGNRSTGGQSVAVDGQAMPGGRLEKGNDQAMLGGSLAKGN
jgi:hypothetical protein